MLRLAPRWHVPLLAALVAVLGLLGGELAADLVHRAGAAPVEHAGAPHDDGVDGSVLAGEMPAIVRVTPDHVRSSRHWAPVVVVLGAALAGLAVARALVAALTGASVRPAPTGHVRPRGPPAFAVV